MILMSCREAAQKISVALDLDLSRPQSLRLWFHLLFCRNCSRLREQLLFLRQVSADWRAQNSAARRQTLKPELRESLEQALQWRDSRN